MILNTVNINGFWGKYSISDCGKVFNNILEKQVPQHDNGLGYMTVVLNKKKYYVHRLVAEYFVSNCEQKPQVNHKDGIKANNDYTNLEWVTAKENIQHYLRNNYKMIDHTWCIGEGNGRSKLTNELVLEIRELIKTTPQHKVASQFGVSQFLISKINRRIIWKHI